MRRDLAGDASAHMGTPEPTVTGALCALTKLECRHSLNIIVLVATVESVRGLLEYRIATWSTMSRPSTVNVGAPSPLHTLAALDNDPDAGAPLSDFRGHLAAAPSQAGVMSREDPETLWSTFPADAQGITPLAVAPIVNPVISWIALPPRRR